MNERDKTGSLLPRVLLFLVPLAAGAGAGAMANLIIANALPAVPADERVLINRFWHGAVIDGGAVPSESFINCAAVLTTLTLWLAFASLLRRGRPLQRALSDQALAFIPSLLVLLACVLQNYGIYPAAWVFGNHAVVFAVAGFAAVNAFLWSRAPKPAAIDDAAPQGRGALTAVLTIAAVYWVTFSAMGALQYYSLAISYTDTADWEQMLWNTLHGRFLMSSAFPHMFFGEHVQVSHLFLLPLYALFPSLVTLMIAKSAILASGALPVFFLARRRLASAWPAAAFAAAYLLYPAMQYTDLEIAPNTFRPEAFAIPALLWAVYFLDANRIGWLALSCAFAISCKEEMALPVMMIGVLLLFDRKWLPGALFTAVAAVWFVVAVAWIIPHYRGGASHIWNYYLDFGDNDTFARFVLSVLKSPLHTLSVALRLEKIDYLLTLLVPLGLLPLFSRRMLFIIIPSLATTLLAGRRPSFEILWHYQIAVVPFMLAGAIYGARACASFAASRSSASGAPDDKVTMRALTVAFGVLVLTSSLLSNVLYAKSPISFLFYNARMKTYWTRLYVPGDRARLFFQEVRPLVPPDASVSATEFLATYFAARRDDFIFPDGIDRVDYVIVDTRDEWLGSRLREKELILENVLRPPRYGRIYDKDGFIVLRKFAPLMPDPAT